MKKNLTEQDRKKLKSSSRIGFVFGMFIFLPSLAIWFISNFGLIKNVPDFISPTGIVLSFLILWLVNRKYWNDLRKGEKDVLVNLVERKESKKDFEARSSVGYSTNRKKHAFYSGMS